MSAELSFSFLAGVLSVATPCVLPLVPAYLAGISALEAERLGAPRVAHRVVAASAPFIVGFTLVFVAVGTGAAGLGAAFDERTRSSLAGLVLVVVGLAFMGLLPAPRRVVAPALLQRGGRSGSSALLGASFAVCAAPCVGPVLGSALALAGETGSTMRGAALLAAYSAGLATAFLAIGVAYGRTMGAFRWARDRFLWIQIGGGAVLVAFGLLLFFEREWWLRVYVSRAMEALGLS